MANNNECLGRFVQSVIEGTVEPEQMYDFKHLPDESRKSIIGLSIFVCGATVCSREFGFKNSGIDNEADATQCPSIASTQ